MPNRVSKGCLRCRSRRVKCDEGRPACNRCIKRNEVCTGYRDDSTLVFRDENEKAAQRSLRRRNSAQGLSRSRSLSKSSEASSARISKGTESSSTEDPSDLSAAELSGLNLPKPFPWAKSSPRAKWYNVEDQAVDRFFENYVMYPCNDSSSPGFLEQLPSLFDEANLGHKLALRWAVRACAYANLSNEQQSQSLGRKALKCYGLALKELAESLAKAKETPDDFILMTVVVLDLFEAVFLQDPVAIGSHAEGMAQILRLRGPDQIYGSRGWSLFRLAHHRLQRQQLLARQPTLLESEEWLNSLDEQVPYVSVEKENFQINKTCERARNLLASIEDSNVPLPKMLDMIKEMHELDLTSATWRNSPNWAYRTVHRSDITQDEKVASKFPEYVQLHRDVWIAYEWNYNRTGRLLMHEQLLRCIDRCQPLSCPAELASDMMTVVEYSVATVQSLVDEILSTVPQSLGDIDQAGNVLDSESASPKCKGVGGYFLLWPIKISKSTKSATPKQRAAAQAVFERIRECTGMKSALGEASSI